MSALEEIKIELKGVASILKEQNSFVPKYQRSYAWRKQNVLAFLYDISGAIQTSMAEYFLGSIVISQKDKARPEIVDGQQRLATTCIVIAAIRDYFHTLKTSDGDERARMIYSEYLAKKELDSLAVVPKLNLNYSDHGFFVNTILSEPGAATRKQAPAKSSHERLAEASETAKDFIAKLAATTNDPSKLLIQWITYLEQKVKAIVVRVPDESNAFTIFETLNDRGLDLAVSDLLKNYLFFKAENRVTEAQSNWIQMIANIETAEGEQAVVSFIRYYWSSRNGLVREKELFDRIKKHITSKTEAISVSEALLAQSSTYAAMVTCDDTFWANYAPGAKVAMHTLNFFSATQMRPLLLSVLTNFDNVEAAKALRLLVNISVRFLIVGGLGSGSLEEKYSSVAVRIYKGEIKTSKQLAEAMSDTVPNDRAFETAFSNATVSKNYLARYYLRTLEEAAQGKGEPEFIPNASNDVVTLEHVLPENPSADWSHIGAEDAKANYKRIGNMALMVKSSNNGIGNAGFPKKAELYKKSEYSLTSELGTKATWTLTDIAERQQRLAALAVKAWPVQR